MWQHPNGYYYYSKTSLGTKDKREALKREQELRRVKWLEKHKLINNKVVNNTTLKELIDQFKEYRIASKKNTSKLPGIYKRIEPIKNKYVHTITQSDIQPLFSDLQKNSQASYLKELRVIFNFGITHSYLIVNLIAQTKIGNREVVFSDNEYYKLLSFIDDEKFKSLIEFAYESGCRQSECINKINWLDNGIIVKGKTGERIIPYKNPLYNLSRFKGLQWDYLTKNVTSKRTKKYIRSAGLSDKFCFETLRHTFGTKMVKVAGIHQTSLLMEHTSFNTTQKYLHISINDYSFSNNNLCNYL